MTHIPKLFIFWEEEFVKGKIFVFYTNNFEKVLSIHHISRKVLELYIDSHIQKNLRQIWANLRCKGTVIAATLQGLLLHLL